MNRPQWQARALAALRDVEQLKELLDEIETLMVGRERVIAWSLVRALEVITAHGSQNEIAEVLDRALEWFDGLSGSQSYYSEYVPDAHAIVLFVAGGLEDALAVIESVVSDDYSAWNIQLRGYRGFYAASRGDTVQAARDIEWLTSLDGTSLSGQAKELRAAIAGGLGDRDQAVDLLRQAFQERRRREAMRRYYAEFVPLRGYPPFEELMRPKG